MSDELNLYPVLLQIREVMRLVHNILVEILKVLRTGFQALSSLEGVGRIAKIQQSTFGKQEGIGGQDDLLSYLQKIFSGDIFQPLSEKSGASSGGGGGKAVKGLGKMLETTFKDIGESILSAFDPMLLILQLIQPAISAIIEPLNLLSPLLEAWGQILAQLLYPVVIALMEAFEPITPILQMVVESLLPIIELLVLVIQIFAPILEIIAQFIAMSILVGTTALSPLVAGLQFLGGMMVMISDIIFGTMAGVMNSINEFLTYISTTISNVFTNAVNIMRDGGIQIRDAITGVWDDIINSVGDFIDRIKEKFNVFSGGGLDNNTDTWW